MQHKLESIKSQVFGRFEVRKTVKQKEDFAQWVCEYAAQLGYRTDIERSGKIVDTRNIIFGDLSKAKTLITAHYDTCARLPFPNFMTPQCWPMILLTQVLLPVALFLALGFGAGYGAGKLVRLLGIPHVIGGIATILLC